MYFTFGSIEPLDEEWEYCHLDTVQIPIPTSLTYFITIFGVKFYDYYLRYELDDEYNLHCLIWRVLTPCHISKSSLWIKVAITIAMKRY